MATIKTEVLNPSGHIVKVKTVLDYHTSRMLAAIRFNDSLYAFASELAQDHAVKAAHESQRTMYH